MRHMDQTAADLPQHGTEGGQVSLAGRHGGKSVEQMADADRVATILEAGEHRGAGQRLGHHRADLARERFRQGFEGRQPRFRARAAGRIEKGNVGVKTGDLEMGQRRDAAHETGRVVERHPQAAQTAIHLYIDGRSRARRVRHGFGGLEIVDRGDEIAREKRGNIARQKAAEDQDRRADAGRAHRHRLGDIARSQRINARVRQSVRTSHRAVTVGIGLDGGDDLHTRTDAARDFAEIMLQRTEVDHGPGWLSHFGHVRSRSGGSRTPG